MATIDGTPMGDTLVGTAMDDIINGLAGDDVIEGSSGNDIIDGGDGFDTVIYRGGDSMVMIQTNFNDVYTDGGVPAITGVEDMVSAANFGTDSFTSIEQVIVYDDFDQIVSYARLGTDNADTLDLTQMDPIDTFAATISLWLGGGDDVVTLGGGNSTVFLGDGNDTVTGGDFVTVIIDGAGDDTVVAGDAFFNLYIGGEGSDSYSGGTVNFATVDYFFSDAAVTVDLTTGAGFGGHAEGDSYTNVNSVRGSDFADTIFGTDNRSDFNGRDGADTIVAGAGDDTIFISAGGDTLTGGDGADEFIAFRNTDSIDGEITDFSVFDTLVFPAVTFDDQFVMPFFIGTDAFSGSAGELRYELGADSTTVEFDLTGDGVADSSLLLSGGAVELEFPTDGLFTDLVLRVAGASDDDFAGDTTTTGTIAVDGSATGAFEQPNFDQDWFAITLDAGQTVRATSDNFAADLSAYDDAGGFVASGGPEGLVFTAVTAGTYYIEAAGFGPETYTLSVEGITDDYAADASTTGVITLGGIATGEFEVEFDRDWFAFDAAGGETVTFGLDIPESIQILDDTGTFLAFGFETLSYTFEQAGRYYIEVEGTTVTPYVLSADTLTDDYADDTTTTGTITLGGFEVGETETDFDSDWFAFQANAGDEVTFSVDVPSDISIYDAQGNFLSGGMDVFAFNFDAAGTYFVGVTGFQTGIYTLSAFASEDDFAADTTTTGTLALGGTSSGTWEVDFDSDWFAFEATAGDTVRFSLDSPENISIYDAQGVFLANNFESLTYTFGTTDTYYIAAESGIGGIDYQLSAQLAQDDFADDASTTGTLALNGSSQGEFEDEFNFDSDWFAFEAMAGQTVRFDIDVPEGLSLFDAQGNFLAGNLEGFTYNFTETATFYVAAEGLGPIAYTVSATELVDDIAGSTATDRVLEVGGSDTGVINFAEDSDWFAVTVDEPTNLAFTVDSFDEFGFFDLTLFDADGNPITGGGNTLNTSVEAGTYYVGVRGFDPADYTISLDTFEDDYSEDDSTGGLAIVNGTVYGTIDFEGDRDWFAIELEQGQTIQPSSTTGGFGEIYDANGNFVDGFFGAGSQFTAFAAGTYYLSVGGFGTGDYALTVLPVGDDFSDNAGSRGRLTINETAEGTTDYIGDADVFVVRLLAGQRIDFSADGGTTLQVQDAFGRALTVNGESAVFDVTEDGTYYVSVSGLETGTDYTVTATQLATDGDDRFFGTDGDDVFDGGLGNDTIVGEGGMDMLSGGAGNDLIFGNAGDDMLSGGEGDDKLVGGAGADVLDGGAGRDIALYTTATEGVTINLTNLSRNSGDAAGDTYTSIEAFFGSQFRDTIVSDAGAHDLFGLGGNDLLVGLGGNDRLFGGDGNDILNGGRGNDDLFGGEGADRFVFRANDGQDRLFDFSSGEDVIQMNGGPGSVDDLDISVVGNNTVIVSSLGQITLFGFTGTLTDADFDFRNPTPTAVSAKPEGDDVYELDSGFGTELTSQVLASEAPAPLDMVDFAVVQDGQFAELVLLDDDALI